MNTSRHAPVAPGAAASDTPPQLDRALSVMRDMKEEYDAALRENKDFLTMRREYHIKFEQQLHELEQVERSLADLEATHNKFKADADAEIAHLKAQLAQQRQPTPGASNATVGAAGASTSAPAPPSTATTQPDPSVKDSTDNNGNAARPRTTSDATVPHTANGIPPSSVSVVNSSSLPMSSAAVPSTSNPPASAADHSASLPLGPQRHQQPLSSINPMQPSDPISANSNARSLPSTLPAPLSSLPSRNPGASDQSSVAHGQHHPYGTPIPSAFSTSRPMYQPAHARLQHPHQMSQQHSQQHLHQYPAHHPHPTADQMPMSHQSKLPRFTGPSHPHQLQLSHNASGPLPSPGSLAGGPPAIPSMMSSAPNGARQGTHHDVQPIPLMSNGPPQQQDALKGPRGRLGGPRPGQVALMGTTSRALSSGVTPSTRGRHPSLTNADEPSRMNTSDDDWGVLPGRGADGAVINMNVTLQRTLVHDSVVCCVRYSWDGRFLATGSNRSAHMFDATTGASVAKFIEGRPGEDENASTAQDSYVRAVCFSPNGEWLITGAEDHVVKVWDVRNRVVKHRLCGHGTDIYSVDASANGSFIISGSGDKKAKLWSLENGTLLSTLGGDFGPTDGITSVSVSPSSQYVAAGSLDKIVRVWDVETSRLVRQFEGHKDSVYSVAFSPDGRMLLSGSLDKTLKLWDLAASQQSNQCRLPFKGHSDFVLSVAFSPSGRWLISGSKDRTVRFWDQRQSTTCLTLQGHKNSVISIAHSPTSNFLATGSGDCRARTWLYD